MSQIQHYNNNRLNSKPKGIIIDPRLLKKFKNNPLSYGTLPLMETTKFNKQDQQIPITSKSKSVVGIKNLQLNNHNNNTSRENMNLHTTSVQNNLLNDAAKIISGNLLQQHHYQKLNNCHQNQLISKKIQNRNSNGDISPLSNCDYPQKSSNCAIQYLDNNDISYDDLENNDPDEQLSQLSQVSQIHELQNDSSNDDQSSSQPIEMDDNYQYLSENVYNDVNTSYEVIESDNNDIMMHSESCCATCRSNIQKSYEISKTILKKLNEILLKNQNQPNTINVIQNIRHDLLPEFPLSDWPSFIALNNSLMTDKNCRDQFEHKIGLIGGSDYRNFTFNILSVIFSKDLALEVSWSGKSRQGNTFIEVNKFKDTLICQSVIRTVINHYTLFPSNMGVTEELVKNAIKLWLQRAGDRTEERIKEKNQKRRKICHKCRCENDN